MVLLGQRLRVTDVAMVLRVVFLALLRQGILILLRGLQLDRRRSLLARLLGRRARARVNVQLRLRVYPRRLILGALRQAVSVLPEMLLRVA